MPLTKIVSAPGGISTVEEIGDCGGPARLIGGGALRAA
jgi:hypothetical protein